MEENWIRVRVQVDEGGRKFNTDALYDTNNKRLDRVVGNIVDMWEDGFLGGSLMIPQPDKLPDGFKQGA